MAQIHDLGIDLQSSAIVCSNGRRNLKNAKETLIQRVIEILAKSQRREIYKVYNLLMIIFFMIHI